eukprot:jgi/Ulvmu1/5523/UM023_0059.1
MKWAGSSLGSGWGGAPGWARGRMAMLGDQHDQQQLQVEPACCMWLVKDAVAVQTSFTQLCPGFCFFRKLDESARPVERVHGLNARSHKASSLGHLKLAGIDVQHAIP